MFDIIRPHFFEKYNGTINSEQLRVFLRPELQKIEQNNIWLQQDGTTAHTVRQTQIFLVKMFPCALDIRIW